MLPLKSIRAHLCAELAWPAFLDPALKQSQADDCLGVRDTVLIFHCTIGNELTALYWHLFLLQEELDSKLLEDMGILGSVLISRHIVRACCLVTISGMNEYAL